MTKAQERQLQENWQRLLSKHSRPLERGHKAKGRAASVQSPSLRLDPSPAPHGRPTSSHLPSRVSSGGSATVTRTPKRYTGEEMLGLGQLHKSNLVPVFRKQDAIDIAKMRRG
jgi:hypothetical protein